MGIFLWINAALYPRSELIRIQLFEVEDEIPLCYSYIGHNNFPLELSSLFMVHDAHFARFCREIYEVQL